MAKHKSRDGSVQALVSEKFVLIVRVHQQVNSVSTLLLVHCRVWRVRFPEEPGSSITSLPLVCLLKMRKLRKKVNTPLARFYLLAWEESFNIST